MIQQRDLAEYSETHHATGERNLWLHVIEQAFKDASMVIPKRTGKTNAKTGERREGTKPGDAVAAQVEARRWFSEDCDDFKMVCTLAGLDSDWVRELARKKLHIKGVYAR